MKRLTFLLICAAFLCCFTHINAQETITGDVVIANSGVGVGLKAQLSEGTMGRFSFNGSDLSLEINQNLYESVQVSAGLGFRPDGESCFYVSFSDGLDKGLIEVEGTDNYSGESLIVKNVNFGTKIEFCPRWVMNTATIFTPSIAGYQRMAARPRAHTRSIPRLIWEAHVKPSVSYEEDMEKTLVLHDKSSEVIEAYCIDSDKNIPMAGLAMKYDRTSEEMDELFSLLPETQSSPFTAALVQDAVYQYIDILELDASDILMVGYVFPAYFIMLRGGVLYFIHNRECAEKDAMDSLCGLGLMYTIKIESYTVYSYTAAAFTPLTKNGICLSSILPNLAKNELLIYDSQDRTEEEQQLINLFTNNLEYERSLSNYKIYTGLNNDFFDNIMGNITQDIMQNLLGQ